MTLSERGRQLLGTLEGVRLQAYRDSAGLLTIGVGHLLTRDELSSGKIYLAGQPVKWGAGLRAEHVAALLAQDIAPVEQAVSALVRVPVSQAQFDALVIFAFNVGREAFAKSALLRLLNAGQAGQVPAQLRRWVYAGGQQIVGLAKRREAEAALWQEGVAV
jgi:lysozyme